MYGRPLALLFALTLLLAPGALADEAGKQAGQKTGQESAADYYMRGLEMMSHGRWDKAEEKLQKALEIDPRGYNARLMLGRVYEKSKKKLKAVEQYRKAIELDKAKAQAYRALMGVYFDMTLPKESVSVGEEALKNGVPEREILTDLGWFYYWANDLDKAEERLRAAAKLLKDDTTTLNDLGLVLFSKGEYDGALSQFKEAYRINPDSQVAPYFMAVTYNKLGRQDEALAALRDALKKDPKLEVSAFFYNRNFFPNTETGDMRPLFEKMRKGDAAK